MKKSTRRGCPLAGSCRPIYHPPSLEKANRAYARWGRAMRRARWARRGARALAPAAGGFCRRGVYRFSRNPMYLAYFLIFAGCAALGRSPLLLGLTAVFQVAAHWLIRAEERWGAQRFGEVYGEYAGRVRRYF